MLHYIYPTNIYSNPLHWYTITDKVYQGSAGTTTQHRDMVHILKRVDITVSSRILDIIYINSMERYI